MLNLLFKYLLKRNKCLHERITPNTPARFCPDCGQEVDIVWYLARCGQCSSKRQASFYIDSIQPAEKYCHKCGCQQFYIQKKINPSFYDLNYCVLVKEVINKSYSHKKVQIWAENNEMKDNSPNTKLIPVFIKS